MDRVRIRERGAFAEVSVEGSDAVAQFRKVRIESLTERVWIEEVLPRVEVGERVLVSFERASPLVRREMRRLRVSWQADDGELMLDAPPLYVERPGMRSRGSKIVHAQRLELIHFAKQGSRVTRWLVNHPDETTTVGRLANELALTESTVSRSIAALRASGFIQTTRDEDDRRSKPLQLIDGGRLLEKWSENWRRKQVKVVHLDIGTQSVSEAIDLVRSIENEKAGPLEWMLGGLNGAAAIAPAVQPADLFMWIRADQLDRWMDALIAVEVSRSRANLRLALAADPWIFTLADRREARLNRYERVAESIRARRGDLDNKYPDLRASMGTVQVPVADPAQIYLDCGREGERALEAADAVKRVMNL